MFGPSVMPQIGDDMLHDALYAALRAALMVQLAINRAESLTSTQRAAVERALMELAETAPTEMGAAFYAEVMGYFGSLSRGGSLRIDRTPSGRFSVNQLAVGDTLLGAMTAFRARRQARRGGV